MDTTLRSEIEALRGIFLDNRTPWMGADLDLRMNVCDLLTIALKAPDMREGAKMEHLEPKEQWYLLNGKIAHLKAQILRGRSRIQDLTPRISIDNIGVYNEGATLLPRISPEILDNAKLLLQISEELLTLQEQYNDARTLRSKIRELHYQHTRELLNDEG